jgi:hypothetical protein
MDVHTRILHSVVVLYCVVTTNKKESVQMHTGIYVSTVTLMDRHVPYCWSPSTK